MGEARILFENPKNRLLLVVDDDGVYIGHLMRDDVPESRAGRGADPARTSAATARQIGPDDSVADALPLASETFDNRLVVVGEDGRLEGLLCLNKRDGYLCVDVRA